MFAKLFDTIRRFAIRSIDRSPLAITSEDEHSYERDITLGPIKLHATVDCYVLEYHSASLLVKNFDLLRLTLIEGDREITILTWWRLVRYASGQFAAFRIQPSSTESMF